MEKPFLDFAFSLGKMDVMSIGPGDANIGAAVSNMIKGILESMMVFPQRMVVPILEEQDIMVSSLVQIFGRERRSKPTAVADCMWGERLMLCVVYRDKYDSTRATTSTQR